MLIAIDDTDSDKGMCTTYLAAKLCKILGVTETPRLIRLNPNIPYKTRGNGAVSFKTENENAAETVLAYVKTHSMLDDERTNPGVAILENDVSRSLEEFYLRAVSEHVTVEDAERAADEAGAETHKFKNGRGIIGALAALGFTGETTYELIAYRAGENYGRPRRVDVNSVKEMDRELWPLTFDNLDLSGKRVLITPRGRDPILCGIRGLNRAAVESAWRMVRPLEPVELVQVFETNHATDAHLRRKRICDVRPYDCVKITGTVASKPKIVPGGHAVFTLADDNGRIDCAAYRKGGRMRDVVGKLMVGDSVTVSGGIGKYPGTVNIEKIEIKSLAESTYIKRPVCCGKNMTSSGSDGGYKCKKCGDTAGKAAGKVSHRSRPVSPGIFDSPPGARRHISMPLFLKPYFKSPDNI